MVMKKLASLLLALTLCASLALPALAAEGEKISADTGAISEPTQETTGESETAPDSAPETAPETGQPVINFTDIPEGHSFYNAIMDCAAKGITSGYDDGTFRPTNPVTKAQFSVMLSRAFYSSEAEKYNTKVYTDQGWFVPYTRALYLAGALTDTSFVSSFATADVMGQTINRYDMAQLMTNIMTAKGFSATSDQKSTAQAKISDYKSIPTQYQDAVKNVFALGIITGYSDGAFGGDNIMNRGQGCVVIYRMAQYMPTGGGSKVAKPETPRQPEPPAQSESKTLTNGKPVTEENVLEILNQLKAQYPHKTSFASGRPDGTPSAAATEISNSYVRDGEGSGRTSMTRGCGGVSAFFCDSAFGKGTSFPARKVPLLSARPGDILIQLTPEGKLSHVEVAMSCIKGQETWNGDTTTYKIDMASGIGGNMYRPEDYVYGYGVEDVCEVPQPSYDCYWECWTRYPE